MPQAKINEAFYDESVYKVLGKVSRKKEVGNIQNTSKQIRVEYFKYLPRYYAAGMLNISLSQDTFILNFKVTPPGSLKKKNSGEEKLTEL